MRRKTIAVTTYEGYTIISNDLPGLWYMALECHGKERRNCPNAYCSSNVKSEILVKLDRRELLDKQQ